MAVWVVRGGVNHEYEDDAIGRGRIAINYDIHEDLSNRDENQIGEYIRTRNTGGGGDKQAVQIVGVIDRFVNQMEKGDWVLMPMSSRKVRIGRIGSDCNYDTGDTVNGFRHWRQVSWYNKGFSVKNIKNINIKNTLKSQLAVTNIDGRDLDCIVERMLEGNDYRLKKELRLLTDNNLKIAILSALESSHPEAINNKELHEIIINLLQLPIHLQKYKWQDGRIHFEERVNWAVTSLKNDRNIKEVELDRNNRKTWNITDSGRNYLTSNAPPDIYSNKNSNMEACLDLLIEELQIIIQGPPGTGKTWLADRIADHITNQSNITRVTFHQSYSYEDFIEGLFPNTDGGDLRYEIRPGVLKMITSKAFMNLDQMFVILIDEINRGNISSIFGEVMTLIDRDKRKREYAVRLPYSGELFYIPNNVLIIGTMNIADRSLISMDSALRRRFGFYDLKPDSQALIDDKDTEESIREISLQKLLDNINRKIRKLVSVGKQIGHAYLLGVSDIGDLRNRFHYKIIPLLEDYFTDDYDSLENILGSGFVDVNNKIITDDWLENNREGDEIFLDHLRKILDKND